MPINLRGDDVNFARLRQVRAMFRQEWDPFVIASLASRGQLRFSQLAYELSRNARSRIADSTLTEIKDRLIGAGLVESGHDTDGHRVYRLTAAGRKKADIIRVISNVGIPVSKPSAGVRASRSQPS